MNQRPGLLLLLSFIWLNAIGLAVSCLAQDPYFVHYQTKDGLPSALTYAVFQDSRGYIWIGSDLGVSRFDGEAFKNYTPSDGLSDNDIFNFLEDSQGRIWLNTFNGAACYFKDEVFYNAEKDPVLEELRMPSFIAQVIEEKNGNIHLVSNGAISKIFTREDKCHTFFNTKDPNNICFSWFDEDGQQFFAHQEGITKAREHEITPYPPIVKLLKVGGYVRAFAGEEYVFLGLRNQIYVFDKKQQQFINWFEIKEIDTEIIHVNHDGEKLWLGTRNGIFFLEFLEGNYSKYTIHKYLEGHPVSSMLRDREGNFWFSTLDDGVFFSPAPKGLHLTSKDGLPTNQTFSLGKDQEDRLWIGSDKNYYSVFDGEEFSNAKLKGITDLEVTRIRHFGDKEHWVLGQGQMVMTYDNKKKYLFAHSDDLAKDRFGYYWFNYRRLYRFSMEKLENMFVAEEDPDFEQKLITPTKELVNLRGIDLKRFICLMPDNQDRMWAGTTTGLYWYKYDSLNVTKGNELPLIEGKITSLAFDSTRNLLWVGSSSSGIHLIRNDSVITTINQNDGLSSDFITSLRLDDQQNLWIGGVGGVDKVIWKESLTQVRPFTLRYGLYNLKVNDIELIGEEVYLATESGLIVLPNSLETPAVCPPVYITDFKVNRQSKEWALPQAYLSHENSMEISFKGLNYRDQGHNAYLYRLVGEDEGWTKTESNAIQYRSLAPGDYHFEVKAKNWASEMCAATARMAFSIKAPYWQQAWFILLMACSLTALLYLLWKIRIQNITRKHRLEQRLVYAENDKLELEKNFLELEMRALRLQMNPHFMFNALNTIKGYYAKDKTREANAYISKFAQLLRLILKNNDKFIALETEIKMLELYINLTQIRYEEVFDYEIKVGPGIDLQDTAIPPMLLQPMVENAIIHGLASQNHKGMIYISFDLKQDTLVAKIRDNGIGRQASKVLNKHKINASQAIQTTEARLAIINKDYGISGSFTIEDLKKADGSAAGTEVTIITPLKTFMASMKTVIIDDETQARIALKQEIELNCPELDLIAEANSVKSGIDMIRQFKPQLVFLDIQLTDGLGFDILEQVNSLNFKIIFTTAYSEYALKAIKFSALDYLLKPVDGEELKVAIKRLKASSQENFNLQVQTFLHNQQNKNPHKRIALHTSDGIHLFELKEIIRCSSEGNYTKFFFTNGKKLLIAKTLKEVEELLCQYNFERIHKSHIINLDHMVRYLNKDNGYVVMSDKSEITVSQRKKSQLLGVLNSFK